MGLLQCCAMEVEKLFRKAAMTHLSINIQSMNACQTEGRSQIQFQPAAAVKWGHKHRGAASVGGRWGY